MEAAADAQTPVLSKISQLYVERRESRNLATAADEENA